MEQITAPRPGKKPATAPAANAAASQFFTLKTLGTVAGCAGAVWITCLVLYNLLPENTLGYLAWRWIALLLSEFVVIVLFLKVKVKSMERWMIAVLNGFIVFINASGINAVSTGVPFNKKDTTIKISSLLPFARDIAWWPDISLLKKIEFLEGGAVLNRQNENADGPNVVSVRVSDTLILVDTVYRNDTVYSVNQIHLTKYDTSYTVTRTTMPTCDELDVFDKWVISFKTYTDASVANREFNFYLKDLSVLPVLRGRAKDVKLVRDPENSDGLRIIIDIGRGSISKDSIDIYRKVIAGQAERGKSKIYSAFTNSLAYLYSRQFFEKTHGLIINNPNCK
jgi:hypothetical protein